MSARSEYLRKLLDDGEPWTGVNETILAGMYEYADGLGLCPECQVKADATDPLRTTPARDGEAEAIMARMDEIPDEMRAGGNVRYLGEEMKILSLRLQVISSE